MRRKAAARLRNREKLLNNLQGDLEKHGVPEHWKRFGDLLLLLLYASLENFGYRQRTVWWRLKAFVTVWKRGHVWGDMTRKGFATPQS